MAIKGVLRVLWLCILGCGVAWGQTNQADPADSQFTQSFGVDSINLQSLSVGINAPVFQKQGAIPFSYSWAGNSGCAVVTDSSSEKWASCGIGFQKTVTPTMGLSDITSTNSWAIGYGSVTLGTCAANGRSTTRTYASLYVTGPDLTTYYLPGADTFTTDAGGPSSCTVNLDDYTLYGGVHVVTNNSTEITATPPNGYVSGMGGASYSYVQDPFGNQITYTYLTKVFNDTLNNSAFNIATLNTATYTDTVGTTHNISKVLTSTTVKTTFGCGSAANDNSNVLNVISEIDYPDGNNLYFTYEPVTGGVTGRISQITYRTGGTASYAYGSTNCTSMIPSSITRTTADGATSYTFAMNGTHGTTTTVLDPGKNKTVYTFQGTDSTGLPVKGQPLTLTEVQTWQNTGTVAAPVDTLISTTIYCYNGNSTNCPTTQASYHISEKDTYVAPGSKTTYSRVKQLFDSYGNVTSIARYDFTTIGGGTADNTTTIAYGSWNGSPCVAVGSGIVNLPCDVAIVDSASHTIAETRYTYNSQGFNTQTQRWTGSTWLTTSATPNPNGTVATSTDVNGQVTNYSYAATGSGGCNALRLTGTSATVSGVTLTTGKTWDCNGGLVLTSTDANGGTSHHTYDEMFRPTSVTDPTTFAVNESYTANSATVSDSFDASATTATVDGLGRTILTQTTAGTQYNTTSDSYLYGGTNWTIKPTYSCLQSLGQPCSTGDTDTYDPLGRPITAVGSNGGTSTYVYNQNDVQVTLSPAPAGENNKASRAEYDGLGRVKSACGLLTSGGTSCGQVMSGSGIVTTNTYSYGSGSSTVVSTRGSQSRTYTYDALGRVTSTTTPETGTTTYTYDSYPSGTCGGWTSEPGQLMLQTNNDGSAVCFVHNDGLGRLTDTGTSAATGNVCRRFRYDNSPGVLGSIPNGISVHNNLGRMVEAETDDCTWPVTAAHQITDEWFSYDNDGRVTDVWESTPHSGGYYHTTAGYYPNGQVNTLSGIPGYSTYTVSLDSNGRPLSSSLGNIAVVNTLTRDGANRPLTIKFGNGSNYDTYVYNPNGTMASYSFLAGSLTDNGILTWNPNNTLQKLAITDGFNSAGTQTCTFGYDDVSRLLTDNCGSTVWNQTYSYDQYDNLTKTGNPGTTWNPGYNASNNHITGAGYDGRGDVTYDLNNTYTWDLYGKVHSAATGTGTATCGSVYHCYTYDALGRLVETSSQTTYSEVLYSPLGRTAIMSGATTVSNVVLPNPGGGSTYYSGTGGSGQRGVNHLDWLGSNRLQTALGSTTAFMDTAYTPYGEMYAKFGTNSPPRQMFTGDFADIYPTALYDTPNREFDFGSGSRWLSADPAHASWNAYSYPTNPNSFTDPSGLCPDCGRDHSQMVDATGSAWGGCYAGVDCTTFMTDGVAKLDNPTAEGLTTYLNSIPAYSVQNGNLMMKNGFNVTPSFCPPPGNCVFSFTINWIDLGPISNVAANNGSWAWNFTKSFFKGFSVFGPKSDPRPSCFGQFLADAGSGFVNSFAPPSPSPGEIIGVGTAMADYSNEVGIVAEQHLAQYGSRISKYTIGEQAGARAGLAGLLANADYQGAVALVNEYGSASSGQCK